MSGSGSQVSRRVSEIVGVALFAAALIWIVSLASYEPSDPVWFFSTGSHAVPLNFAGRVGAFVAEVSFQLFGYASYLIPAVLVVIGWNYFWCRKVDAAGTKVAGAVLLFTCSSAFLSLVFSTLDASGKSFRDGGYVGEWIARELAEILNRTGSLIVVITLIVLGVIMSTQFSFGRMMATVLGAVHETSERLFVAFAEWRESRRREKQRREVIAKHTQEGGAVRGQGSRGGRGGSRSPREAATEARRGGRPWRRQRACGGSAGGSLRECEVVRAAETAEGQHAGADVAAQRAPSQSKPRRRNGRKASTPCRLPRCWIRQRPSARSTNAN